MSTKTIRVGGACGFWGDAASATEQLLSEPGLDYLVYDYLAEITMSIMARARAADPAAGYAHDFVSRVLRPNLPEIARQGVRVITNAGGVNPDACGAAVRRLVADLGLDLKVAVIRGDDLLHRLDMLDQAREMFSDIAFPEPAAVMSANAYIGAFPIAQALTMGADIVITGRCVDSAVTLGACIHAFGWRPEDLDLLAAGSLAGHIIECGPQATGGNFTDWESVVETIDRVGYPIAEIAATGEFTCTKPASTGGRVSFGTVAEQLVYEIGDPAAYVLPDVTCDLTGVTIEEIAPDRVYVRGAKGVDVPQRYKVSVTFADGFRGGRHYSFYGARSGAKARGFAEALLRRARAALLRRNLGDFTETSVEVIGAESQYGAERPEAREVMVKVAAKHPDKAGIDVLLTEGVGLALAAPPSLSGFAGGRAGASPVVRLFSCLLPKTALELSIDFDGEVHPFQDARVSVPAGATTDPAPAPPAPPLGSLVQVPLAALAFARSGDKGDKANIGVIARRAEYFPFLCNALSAEHVELRFGHFLRGPVSRFLLPGIGGLNFLLHEALGGGGIASLRSDPQGKGYAQLLLDQTIAFPRALAERDNLPIEETVQ